MRVLHVVPTYLPATRYGGPIFSVHGLCRALVELGHEVEVCTTSVDGSADSQVPHDRAVDLDGVRVRYFRSSWLRRLYYAPDMQRYLQRALGGFDVMHLHSVFLWPTSMAARVAVAHGVPYLVAPRGMLVPELIRQRSRWVKTAWLQLAEQRTLREAAGLHVTTELEHHDALRVGLSLPPAFVVPNGVDAPPAPCNHELDSELERWIGGRPYVLYLGRLSWKKGIDRLLRALAPGAARLVVCGPDDDGYAVALRGLCSQLGLGEDRVYFSAAVQGEAKWELLRRARCLVLPSLHENFGNVVVEAMAVGCPPIVTLQVGAAELVRDSGAGLLCSAEPGPLREAVERVWTDAALRAAMGERGREYALRTLSWTHVANRMSAVYQAIAAHP
jgi:glycosyltransferase involved in cell wall biosynthesis